MIERAGNPPTIQEYFWNQLPQFEGLINHIAIRTFGDREENQAQSYVIYGGLAGVYKFSKESSMKSFVGKCVKNSLINHNRNNWRETSTLNETIPGDYDDSCIIEKQDLIESNSTAPDRSCYFMELLNSLSKEAKEIVGIILDSPAEFWDLIHSRYQCMHDKTDLREYMREELGWGKELIDTVIDEIKDVLRGA